VVLVNPPSLVLSIVAVPEDDVSVVSVASTMNIETFLSVVSDVSLGTRVPSDFVFVLSSVWSDVSSDTNSESVSELVTNAVVSSLPGSNGLSSSIEDEPLIVVIWVVPVDSQSVLAFSNMLSSKDGLVSGHS
jgi:hypothetical protein